MAPTAASDSPSANQSGTQGLGFGGASLSEGGDNGGGEPPLTNSILPSLLACLASLGPMRIDREVVVCGLVLNSYGGHQSQSSLDLVLW